jgi:hypothetical protein
MKKLITLTIALSVASINFVTAQDALLLNHGIYVRANVPCKSPDVVDTIAFWGKRFGIGHNSCDFKNVQRNGMTIRAKLHCAPRGAERRGVVKPAIEGMQPVLAAALGPLRNRFPGRCIGWHRPKN